MESVRIVAGERSRLEVDSLSTSVGILDSEIGQIRSGSKFLKASGGALFPAGKITATGEDDGGGGETKLLGLATTSLLHIAIRNGIYQNQAANATSSAANLNMTTGKTPNIYSLVSVSSTSVNSLLTRRRRHKRNLSAAALTTSSPPAVSSVGGVRPTLSASSVNNTLSLDRKTLLRQKQAKQLQPNDKAWVRADLQQGCIHVHDRLTPSYPRAVLCTVDTTAGEIAARLGQLGGKCGGILRMTRKTSAYVDLNGNCNGSHGHIDYQLGVNKSNNVKTSYPGSVISYSGSEENQPVSPIKRLHSNNNHAQYYLETNILLSDYKIPSTSSSEVYLNDSEGADMGLSGADSCGLYSGSDMESSTFDDLSPGGLRPSQHRDSLSDAAVLGTNSSVLSPNLDSATEELDPFGSSSDEVELDPSPTHTDSIPTVTQQQTLEGKSMHVPSTDACKAPDNRLSKSNQLEDKNATDEGGKTGSTGGEPRLINPLSSCGSNSLALPLTGRAAVERDLVVSGELRGVPGPEKASPAPALFAQLHGGAMRRLEDDEKPLQMQNEYLSNLGYGDPWRVQEEGMDPEIGCLIRFYAGKPQCVGGADRVQLTGVFNVRKGKLALPVNRWSRRHVTLSGTCLIVSSVKYAHTGKMHILPLIGGKVEEVRRHSHCLAFSSSGPQSQTYYISYDSYTEHLRWHRQAAKIVSQRVSSVDLSCCSLEELPSQLFYSQDLTHLNLKHNYLTGLTHLTRFCRLRSLNLSNNALSDFPLAVCDITSLTELNLQGNLLTSLPSALGTMHNLQTLLLDGNSLNSLPAELGSLEALTYLGLSFNLFSSVPPALERLRGVERLCLAGNQLSSLDMVGLQWLPHRHIDLRLNRLQRVVVGEAGLLSHVAQLDVRDAGLEELDVRTLSRLELLRCDRNTLTLLRVSGLALKGLHTAQNELRALEVFPVPESLTVVDVSRNHLDCVPDWVCESTRLEVLDISHNHIKELPIRLFCSASLRKVLVGCNSLRRLPERLEKSQLEVLDVQHNLLTELPHNLFIKAQSLRYLNASANKLECLPPASLSEEGFSSLQELYLTNNSLTDKSVPLLTGHAHLRVLHLAYNQLQTFPASKMARLEQLEELDLSGNRLRAVPTTILSCRHMHTLSAHSNNITVFPEVLQLQDMKVGQTQHTLSAHSNNITVFPEVLQLQDMKCVDLSCNELCEVVLPESLPAKLQELDLTGNPRLNLDHRSLELLNNIRCFRVDPSPFSLCGSEGPGEPAVWSHGYTEASGVNNKLCVAALALDSFRGSREALYGVFDGDRNVEVPYLLQCTMGDVLAEELHKSKNQEDYMTNTFLTMQRKLGTAGQRLGGSAALCHIRHGLVAPSDRGGGGCFTVTAANVGRCQAVLCRDGKALPLSTTHTVRQQAEYQRARQHHAIITEDNKVNGVTDSTRIMGYSFLCPAVTPRPHISTVTLTPQDEFFILASRGLWDTMSTCEAVEAVRNVPDSLAAAKKLCTLAQGYGCPDSLCAVVVQLSITEDCCCCEPPPPPPSPGLETQHTHTAGNTHHHPGYGSADGTLPLPPPVMGTGSEVSSEVSTSEMSSEVGSTASSDEPANQTEKGVALGGRGGVLGRGAGVYGGGRASFQRQYSGALSDNGLDSEDEEPIAGVFSNGSRVEVEADIHCLRARASSIPIPHTHPDPHTHLEPDPHTHPDPHPSPDPHTHPSPDPHTHPSPDLHTHPNTSVTQQPEPLPPPSCQSAPTPPSSPPYPFPYHQPSPDPETSPDPVVEEELRAVETDTVTPKHTVQGQEVGPGETGAGLCVIGGEVQLGAGSGSGSSSASRTLGGTLGRKGRGNGSVACQGRSQDVIEEVGDAPVRKQGGYFNAPAQPDPDDKLVIPPELEEEIREIMKQQQEQSQTHPQGHQTHPQSPPAAEYYVTPF
ncbi:PH domain leucine-rich repeat protein phosphatase 1-like isoform X2 [Oncorhynchus clarkii lewisi]|uniref:PH domain leucine-rich repeat protein phosphatase 1-like isoform X2 n=1 Tax=Oncorhynchus clarkii lewisi TaxID=490388 RepID=UPI0039B9A41E